MGKFFFLDKFINSYLIRNQDIIREILGYDELWAEINNLEEYYLPSIVKHKDVFEKYRGICAGKTIVLVGTGPTLDYYKPIETAVYIGLNDSIYRKDIKFDYYLLTDYDDCEKLYEDVFSYEYDMTKFFCIPNSKRKSIYIPEMYRNRDDVEVFYGSSVWVSKRNHIYDRTKPFMYPIDLTVAPLNSYGTTFHLMMQIALWMHPKKIIIVGADTFGKTHAKSVNSDDLNVFTDYSWYLAGWRMIKEFANQIYPDIEIVSMNPVGLRGLFKDEYTSEYKEYLKEYNSDF